MAEHEHEFSVKQMSETLGVSRSGYYAWVKRPLSARAQANEELAAKIKEAFEKQHKRYGSPRLHVYLRREGFQCGRHRVARLMQIQGLRAKKASQRHPHTTKQRAGARVAPNLLNQEFTASKPNQSWVGDFTYIDTSEGWLYLAAIEDLYSRKIVGWSMADQMDTALVENAWKMALLNRKPDPGLLHHTDRGSQYTSDEYQAQLSRAQCRVSMSRTGNCYDNAAMESFFSTLKTECADVQFTSKADARSAIFEYIEVWYNRQRFHSTLGYYSPIDFELRSGH
jgi:putative transposase